MYRYRKVSTPEERQQTKWVVFAFGIFIGSLPLSFVLPAIFPTLAVGTPAGFWWEFVNNGVVSCLVPALLPLAIGASILRYRLWDIDLVIRRTLVYGALTATLALVYFGSVLLLQMLSKALTGQQSPVVTVISTLLIAALFSPLRQRIQNDIDRRFYRQKYNAEQALVEFANYARNETELSALTERLTLIVQETMQPSTLVIWLQAAAGESQRAGRARRSEAALPAGKEL